MTPDTYVPYCGMPPAPDEWLSRWTLEPGLLIGLAIAAALILWRSNGVARQRGLAGWALVAVLFVSPLCALSMALFSARVAQHVLLTLVAAPLLALMWQQRVPPTKVSALAFAALFWLWHAPVPYAATVQSDLAYWSMHLSLLGSAVALWAGLQNRITTRPFETVMILAGTAAQMTMLAVLLIFAPSPWHIWHEVGAMSWGMSGMADQTLAGAVMWVAGGLLMFGAVLLLTQSFLRKEAA
ncbi:MAG TPA: cytochrome c oxidase assembly protein [Marivita sp.]|nr:cytochrome c oxidase assembly protein [Marivita sp.]